jgi:hypothetical protein
MFPIIADGSVIAASKLELPKPGDYVVPWFRAERVPSGESPLQIKRFVTADTPWLLIQRFVRSKFFSVSTSELLAVHKTIGLFRFRGWEDLMIHERRYGLHRFERRDVLITGAPGARSAAFARVGGDQMTPAGFAPARFLHVDNHIRAWRFAAVGASF